MSERPSPILLQVCANDHAPFADICRYHEAAARLLSWRPVTVMLSQRAGEPAPDFHYVAAGAAFSDVVAPLLGGRRPILCLCHRYRAYRAVVESRLSVAPVVAVAHEFGLFARWQRRLQRRGDAILGRSAATFAGVSEPVTRELAHVVGDAVLLPNGIDLARADGSRLSRAAARRTLGLPACAFGIGVVGRLHPKKNPQLAVAGLRRAVERMPAARLMFIGDGELAAELDDLSAGLPVTFKGFVPEAARLLSALDLLLLPSTDREAFGMVALEAMAAGVPVLCGSAPGPQFVLGDTGRCFAPTAEALGEALVVAYEQRDSAVVQTRARQARARVEQWFSVAAGAGRLQALAARRAPQ